MIIEFSVGNYRSFRDRKTLSMEAADISSKPTSLDEQNVFAVNPTLRLLTSAVIYGANASGKSNLVKAIDFMRRFVLNSSSLTRSGQPINVEPFRLSTVTESQPSEFEIVFLVDGVQYRYGFAVDRRAVVKEWLYRLGTMRESTLFTRTGQMIEVNPRTFREGRRLESRTRPNALFLSVVAHFNGPIAQRLTKWFADLNVNTGATDLEDMASAITGFDASPYRATIEDMMRGLDVGADHLDAEWKPIMLDPLPEASEWMMRANRVRIKAFHQRFDGERRPVDSVAFDLEQHESAGTQRLFMLLHLIVYTLKEGSALAIDEFDVRIHPNLAAELVRLFNDPATNPRRAQLIFTTYNTNLLSAKLFRRDQVWFIERSRHGESDLHSLLEYRIDGKIVRNDASFEKDYILGRYGATPFIGNVREILKSK